jgi:cytoskeletal protein RodZ
VFEIGSSLRDARMRQGLDLLDVEADTKIRAKYLRALEDERFDLLPGDAYAKGFLRTYADRLGLDGQLYVDEFNSRFSESVEPIFSSRPRQRTQRRLESHAVLIALAGIVAVTVLVIAAWQLGGSAPQEEAPIVPPVESEPSLSTPAAPVEAPEEEPAPSEPTDAPGTSLSIAAHDGSSSLVVRRGSARGEILFEGTLSAGQDRLFDGAKRFWLQASELENLALTVNGIGVEGLDSPGPATVLVTAEGAQVVSSP